MEKNINKGENAKIKRINMNELVDYLLKNENFPVLFSFKDFEKIGFKKEEYDRCLLEGLKNKYIDKVYDNIYILNVKYHKRVVPKKVLSQIIMLDSYVSMYYVLCDYGWIPEMVFSVTSVTTGRNCTIDTEGYGTFIYYNLYNKYITEGISIERDYEGMYRSAKPLRALCDLIYSREKDWMSIDNLYEVYRISKDSLEEDVMSEDFDELQGTFGVRRVEKTLEELRKELRL